MLTVGILISNQNDKSEKEMLTMVQNTSKTKTKRLPKGQRTHIRRVKQAARKEISPNSPQSSPAQPMRVQKKQDHNPKEVN